MRKVSEGTIIRTAVLILALVNQLLTIADKNPLPFSDEQLQDGLSYLFTVCAAIAAWWKNNSFTQPALKADEVMSEIKERKRR